MMLMSLQVIYIFLPIDGTSTHQLHLFYLRKLFFILKTKSLKLQKVGKKIYFQYRVSFSQAYRNIRLSSYAEYLMKSSGD